MPGGILDRISPPSNLHNYDHYKSKSNQNQDNTRQIHISNCAGRNLMFELPEDFIKALKTDSQRNFWDKWSRGYPSHTNGLLAGLIGNKINIYEYVVLTYLFSFINYDSEHITSKKQLSTKLNISNKTMNKTIDNLVKRNIIKMEPTVNKGISYFKFTICQPEPCVDLHTLCKNTQGTQDTLCKNTQGTLCKSTHPPCVNVHTIDVSIIDVSKIDVSKEDIHKNSEIKESPNKSSEIVPDQKSKDSETPTALAKTTPIKKPRPPKQKPIDNPLYNEIFLFWNQQHAKWYSPTVSYMNKKIPLLNLDIKKEVAIYTKQASRLVPAALETIDDWKGYITRVFESDFLRGQSNVNWAADLKWVTDYEKYIQIKNGKYDNKRKKIDKVPITVDENGTILKDNQPQVGYLEGLHQRLLKIEERKQQQKD